MMLTDPIPALAEQNNFVGYLVGLAGLARAVHALARDDTRADTRREADDFVHLLLGVARLGDAISRLAETRSDDPPAPPKATTSDAADTRWLR